MSTVVTCLPAVLMAAVFCSELSTTHDHQALESEGQLAAARPSNDRRAAPPTPGEELTLEIAKGVKMAFCYIPAGEAQLGSPKAEREAVLKYLGVMDVPHWLAAEAEEKRGKYTSKGFWLGKYEVTQKEWKAVEGSNPSEFDGELDNGAKGLDTTHFPVETVSWYDCKGFANALNKRADAAKVFGKGSRICLPDENEWEYAYRGGKGNGRAFYWGDTLDGSQANCSGSAYGTDKKGTYLDRPCSVAFTNDGKYEAHPWGLMHMSGNVAE